MMMMKSIMVKMMTKSMMMMIMMTQLGKGSGTCGHNYCLLLCSEEAVNQIDRHLEKLKLEVND